MKIILKKINNKHEGYGYAAEVFARMEQDVKRVNGTMKTYPYIEE